MADDQYERSAEFVDVMLASHWENLGPVLARALRGVPADAGPIVDVGAGGGLGTMVIADAVPDAEILAIEPSLALRSVLMARAGGLGLRERVSVLPEGLLEAPLPARLGSFVAMNVIGHFDPAERLRIWDLLADRLAPAGRAVLNLQEPAEPVRVPEFQGADVRIGRRRYVGSGRAEPAGADALTWHMTYRTYHEEKLVDETRVSYAWWPLTEAKLREELAERGFLVEPTGPGELGTYVITRERKPS
jgi:hypothetical protein